MEIEDRSKNLELAERVKRSAEKLRLTEPVLSYLCQMVEAAADFGHVSGYPGWPKIQDAWTSKRPELDQSSEPAFRAFLKLLVAYIDGLSVNPNADLVKALADSFDTVLVLSKRQNDLSINVNAPDSLSELIKHYDSIGLIERTATVSFYQSWLKGLIEIFALYRDKREPVTVTALIENYLTHFSMPRVAGNDETTRRLLLCAMECQQLVLNELKKDKITLIEPIPGKEGLDNHLHQATTKVEDSARATIIRVLAKGFIRDGIVEKRAEVEVELITEGSYKPPI